ncbi:MAG TPA: hypothetical protein VJR46_06925 [Candidatus Dormibacteraeota bacterium]|nr:hypothetical protein [Candidatus Dormibacteraeota bacterium]
MRAEEPAEDSRSDLDRALEQLLVSEVRVRVDPTTGQIVSNDGEKSPLTDSPETHTLT